jgi:glutamate/tyrosine decarboxylase-like PLP-dependent enzyme
MTPEEFRVAGHALVDWIADYRERLSRAEFPVQATVKPGDIIRQLPTAPPADGEAFTAMLDDLDRIVMPGMTHWQHPRFFGYFPSGGNLTSVLGDMVSTAFSSIGLNWQASPALTEVEQVMTDWLRDLLGLPATFSGVLQDTASAASFVALVSARERANHYGATRAGLQSGEAPLVVYVSEYSHSSIEKAAVLAGFGREHIRALPVDADYRLDVTALSAAIAADRAAGLHPAAVVATSGTTGVTAFDPIADIAAITQREGLWLHLDAAMGGSAMVLPEYRHLWAGVEAADSIVVNPHKWLSVAFDCSLYLVRDPEHLIRVMSTNPSYLQTAVDREVRNYRDWGIPLGRRFRALKIWFALRDQGTDAIQARLRAHLTWARDLADWVEAAPEWCLVAPLTLQTVVIRHEPAGLRGEALDAHTRAWAQGINDSGAAVLTPTVVAGRWAVRVSIGAEYTRAEHIAELWSILQAAVAPPPAD